MPLRYLIDENLAPAFRTELMRRDRSLVVWMVGDPNAPPRGTSDPDILVWCEENGFVLVTNNRKTMPVHLADHLAAGRHVPGILTLDLSEGMARLLDELILIAGASRNDEYQDRIEYMPLP